MKHARIAFAVTAAALVLAGCSDADSPAPSASASTATSTISSGSGSADSSPTPEPAPTDASDKTSPASAGAKLTVTDIRTGRHENFDRVVYEMGGTGTPGWRVGYVDRAVQDGSGNDVAVAGGAILQVLIDGSAYPFDSGVEPYSGPNPVLAQPGGSVVEVNGSGVFEGVTQSFVGVAEPNTPFAVYALTNPTRLVVDVAR
ncbi:MULTISPECIES: hypothetical protein [Rhodococcus]|jgi:hypothetical protein|uniref:AMIN-like domain-containing protein n=1 Tax=Rhodococcus aetherivorans TaxID=191292 RepID=A0A059MTZ1_9NOCA|nr:MULTISPECIES: hypothetical protein [Rhodococcus]ETT26515.1 hypothetical protein RR21198_3017 [Rhodococcus rhodochrous ATCC 21198]AKE89314.1 hypothetical protein AAT18_08750 [Rhodococcus aetherivorans]ANZ25976.1 hypothetical protein A4U64_15830 [Rhodococcus sp. WB1]KDE14341.1 hypothetical protein N505_0105855 [Rhodococcus aetherivorans]MBC2590895.1 hypothetical protein [Rhodococcus aetherivorans]